MKLSRASWTILTVGIFIVAFVSLGIARSQQGQEQKQLKEELSVAELSLNKVQLKQLYSQKSKLEQQLNQTISQLQAAKDALRQSIESITVTDSVFKIAEACDVEITQISSSGLGSDELEGITSAVNRLTIGVKGDLPNLISFIIRLNHDFTTGVVNSAEITIPKTTGEDKPSANIPLAIYTYRGG